MDTSCKGSTGLGRNASAPALSAWSLDSSTDTAMTGTASASLKSLQRSSPVPPEMRRSTMTSDGELSRNDSLAASSLSVTSTSKPSVRRKYSWNSAE